jgi:hypothetical protein
VDQGRQRIRKYFSGMVRRVSNAFEGSKILFFLFRPRQVCSSLLHLRSSWKGCSANFRFTEFYEVGPQDRCTYGDLGSGSSQLVQEGSRPPESLGEYGWVLPYAYAQVVLEAEGSPRREHHAMFF